MLCSFRQEILLQQREFTSLGPRTAMCSIPKVLDGDCTYTRVNDVLGALQYGQSVAECVTFRALYFLG